MIRPIREGELEECVRVIRDSFSTVAEAFGLSPENAPRFTAFATTLERLAGQYREGRAMFLRRYWYGESVAEVALALGCGEGKVKSSLFRSRKALRAFLEKEGITV